MSNTDWNPLKEAVKTHRANPYPPSTQSAHNAVIVQDHIHRWISPDDGGTHCSICGVHPPLIPPTQQDAGMELEGLSPGTAQYFAELIELSNHAGGPALELCLRKALQVAGVPHGARIHINRAIEYAHFKLCWTIPRVAEAMKQRPSAAIMGTHHIQRKVAGMHPLTPEKSQRQGAEEGQEPKCGALWHVIRPEVRVHACPECGATDE